MPASPDLNHSIEMQPKTYGKPGGGGGGGGGELGFW